MKLGKKSSYILSVLLFIFVMNFSLYAFCNPYDDKYKPCRCCVNGNWVSGCCSGWTCCGSGASRGCCHTGHPCIDCIGGQCVTCEDNPCKFCCAGQECCDQSNCEICKDGSCERAVPTNMHETLARDSGGGILYFEYEWDSTTGDLNDLYNCFVREKVDYPGGNPYYWPSPPWNEDSPNPTISGGLAVGGKGHDTHYPGNIVQPYAEASFSANQVYQYHCGPDCCMGDDEWETLLDIGPIMRFVIDEDIVWRYSIIKSGEYAEIFPLP